MITTKKTKIFISHKRLQGKATAEAILIKDALDKKKAFDAFMDVREDYIGDFPNVLKNRIKDCDVFVLIFANDSIDYLLDRENWVHKEIHYALNYKDLNNKPVKIIPIAFSNQFKFPQKSDLDDIAEIADFNIFYYDTNDSNCQQKLYNAIGNKSYVNIKKLILFILCIFTIILLSLFMPNHKSNTNSIPYPQIENYVEKMNSITSLEDFVAKASTIQQEYLSWYLEELQKGNRDITLNSAFNEYYLKEWVIRLTILSYVSYTSGDTELKQDANFIQELITKSYDKIPEKYRYPIGLNFSGVEDRRAVFSECLDVVLTFLNECPQLQKLDETQISQLKAAILKISFPLKK